MSLSSWAEREGVNRKTALYRARNGLLPQKVFARQDSTSHWYIQDLRNDSSVLTAIYTRVSPNDNVSSHESLHYSQRNKITATASVEADTVVSEVAPFYGDKPRLKEILEDSRYVTIFVADPSVINPFGLDDLNTVLQQQGRSVVPVDTSIDLSTLSSDLSYLMSKGVSSCLNL